MSKKTYHQENLREKLIQTAKVILLKNDIKSITIRRISKELEVSPMAFYTYFKNLEDFLNSIAKEYIIELEEISKEAVTNLEGLPRIYKLGETYIFYSINNPKKFLLMFRPSLGSPTKIDWQKTTLYRVLADTISKILPQDSSQKEIHLATISTWSLVHGFAMLVVDGPLSELQKDPKMLKIIVDKVVKSATF